MSCWPSNPNAADNRDVGERHGQAGLDEEMLPLALADGEDAGEAAEEDVRRQLDRRPADRAGQNREQRDHDGADGRRPAAASAACRPAAVGMTYGSQARPPGSFTARTATTKIRPIEDERAAPVPVLGPEPPQPAEQQRGDDGRRAASRRPRRPRSTVDVSKPKKWILIMSAALMMWPLSTMTWPALIGSEMAATFAAAASRACLVSVGL